MESTMEGTYEELLNLYSKFRKSHNEKFRERECNMESGEPSNDSNMAQDNFSLLLERLSDVIASFPDDSVHHVKLLSMKSSLMYEQAKVCMAMEEFDRCQLLLEQALEEVQTYRDHPDVTFLYMRLINHMAYILSRRGLFERSCELLESVLDENEPKHEMLVYNTDELFGYQVVDQSLAATKINKLVANNLLMLGWIYGRQGKSDLQAEKQHMSLDRQLRAGDKDVIGWALRCLRLAMLDVHNRAWANARYHLLSAGLVLDRLESEFVQGCNLSRAQAELARAWINYGLQLFTESRRDLSERQYPGGFTEEPANQTDDLQTEYLKFREIEVATDIVPAGPIKSSDQARKLFLHSHTWLKRARLYYTLRDYPIDYVNTVLDLSELYRFLAFYEPDLNSQYGVQKKRADALETLTAVLREVRPQCYIAVSVELLRELAETQIEMLGLNLRRLHTVESASGGDEDALKRKMSAITNIHQKLYSVGNISGQTFLDDRNCYPSNENIMDQVEEYTSDEAKH